MKKIFRLTGSSVAGGRQIKGQSHRSTESMLKGPLEITQPNSAAPAGPAPAGWVGYVQLGVVYLCRRRFLPPLGKLFQCSTTLTVKKRVFVRADGASWASVCAHCLVSCHEPPQGSVCLLLLPGHVLHWGAMNWPSASQCGTGAWFPAPHQKRIRAADQQCPPEGVRNPDRSCASAGKKCESLLF